MHSRHRSAGSEEQKRGIALSVVICTCERYDLLPGAIESLQRQDAAPVSFEIVVIDNSPDQERARRFGQRYADAPTVRYLTVPSAGLSDARNRGASAASGPIIAYMDDDARAGVGWVQELIAAHRAYRGRAGVVGGPVRPIWPGAKPDWLDGPLLGYLSIVDLGREMRELGPGEWLAGCNFSLDKAAFEAAGGFRTDLGRRGAAGALLSNEDLEMAERVRNTGKALVYAPNAWVEHVIARERLSPSWFRRRAAWQAVSDLLSRPERAEVLAQTAARRLSQLDGRAGVQLGPRHPTAAAVKADMERVYSLVMLGLSGNPPRRQTRLPRWLWPLSRRRSAVGRDSD